MQNWYFQSIVDEKFVKEFFQNCLRLARPLSCGKKKYCIFCGARRFHCGVEG